MTTTKLYKCSRCGHIEQIKTNHYGECYSLGHYNCCPACPPWAKYPEFGGSTRWLCQEQPPINPQPLQVDAMKTHSDRFGLLIDIIFPAQWGWPEIQQWTNGRTNTKRMICYQRADRVVLEGVSLTPPTKQD